MLDLDSKGKLNKAYINYVIFPSICKILREMRPCLNMAAVYLDVVFELGGDGDDGCALGHRSLDKLHYLLVLLQSLK